MIDEAYKKAIASLKKNITKHGFFASEHVYHDVWARDSIISLLGGALIEDLDVKKSCLHSIETLKKYQNELGQIPNCVSFREKEIKVDYGEPYGSAVDATMWYVLGIYYYARIFNDCDFMDAYLNSLDKAVFWLRCQDSDSCGLIETHESTGWMDLLSSRGKVLYDNILWYKVLICYSEILKEKEDSEANKYTELGKKVKNKLNSIFWCIEPSMTFGSSKANTLIRKSRYYIQYVSSRDFGWRCDSYANILSILFDVADDSKAHGIVEFMNAIGIDDPFSIKVLYPPISPGDNDWRDYYIDHLLNLPNHYHNGGIWPFVGGFWVCVLSKLKSKNIAKEALYKLAATNKQGIEAEWEFNEWLHGVSGQAMGAAHQAWSASSYILAYNIVMNQKWMPLFNFTSLTP